MLDLVLLTVGSLAAIILFVLAFNALKPKKQPKITTHHHPDKE